MRMLTIALAFGVGFAVTAVAPMAPAEIFGKFLNQNSSQALETFSKQSTAATLELFGMSAQAQEVMDEPIQLDKLIRVEAEDLTVTLDDTVSRDVISRATVRKIAGGKMTDVQIITTPTGTYSSDGLASRNVKYPGIDVEKVVEDGRIWIAGQGWITLPLASGSSFVYFGKSADGGSYMVGSDFGCYFGKGFAGCS